MLHFLFLKCLLNEFKCNIVHYAVFTHTVKNDRDFNSKKLWKCYSKNPLNG